MLLSLALSFFVICFSIFSANCSPFVQGSIRPHSKSVDLKSPLAKRRSTEVVFGHSPPSLGSIPQGLKINGKRSHESTLVADPKSIHFIDSPPEIPSSHIRRFVRPPPNKKPGQKAISPRMVYGWSSNGFDGDDSSQFLWAEKLQRNPQVDGNGPKHRSPGFPPTKLAGSSPSGAYKARSQHTIPSNFIKTLCSSFLAGKNAEGFTQNVDQSFTKLSNLHQAKGESQREGVDSTYLSETKENRAGLGNGHNYESVAKWCGENF